MRSGSAASAKNGKIDVIADDLKERLRKRERKNPGQLRSTVRSREKENATNQIGNVMNKPGHVSELQVQDKWPHRNPQFRDVAEYVRERRRCQRLHELPKLRSHARFSGFRTSAKNCGGRRVACIRSRQAAGTAATTGAARFLSSTCKTLILRKRPLQSPDESNTGNAVSSPLPFKGRLSVSDSLLRRFF